MAVYGPTCMLATVFGYAGTMLLAVCAKAKLGSRPTWRPYQRNRTMHRVILLASSVSVCACTNADL